MGRRNTFQMIPSFTNNLKNAKNEYYAGNLNFISFCRYSSLHVPIFRFSLVKGICDHIENNKLLRKKFGNFSWRQKNRDSFSF